MQLNDGLIPSGPRANHALVPSPERPQAQTTPRHVDWDGDGTRDLLIAAGDGKASAPRAGATCEVHYCGMLAANGTLFDSSRDKARPFRFVVGQGQVIRGWDEALLDMKVGEQRMLKIPPGLGYGAKGAGGAGNLRDARQPHGARLRA